MVTVVQVTVVQVPLVIDVAVRVERVATLDALPCGRIGGLATTKTRVVVGRRPLLVAADPYRTAAAEQLETLGKSLGIPVYRAPL